VENKREVLNLAGKVGKIKGDIVQSMYFSRGGSGLKKCATLKNFKDETCQPGKENRGDLSVRGEKPHGTCEDKSLIADPTRVRSTKNRGTAD